jgi:hypothetical protein
MGLVKGALELTLLRQENPPPASAGPPLSRGLKEVDYDLRNDKELDIAYWKLDILVCLKGKRDGHGDCVFTRVEICWCGPCSTICCFHHHDGSWISSSSIFLYGDDSA